MPRVRAHWALLVRTRDRVFVDLPLVSKVLETAPEAFFAGGVAPDAIRLFAGADKATSHFYDDHDVSTWDAHTVVDKLVRDGLRGRAENQTLSARAWCYGYVAHILADIANWRWIMPLIPPFPAERAAHHGVWLLADRLPVPEASRSIDLRRVPYEDCPPWVDPRSVHRLLTALVTQILPLSDWSLAEASHLRHNGDLLQAEPLDLPADPDLLSSDQTLISLRDNHIREWESSVERANVFVPPIAWKRFEEEAIDSAVGALAHLSHLLGDD